MDRRTFAAGLGAGLASSALTAAHAAVRRRSNIIIVLADDLGYGDLGAYGAELIRTPALDRMAREGMRFTNAYASANVCTPSRAGLLTGRYPIRTGLAHDVIRANDTRGLPLEEITIAEVLKPDYATAFVGKWHLGHVAPYWPPSVQGFDLFYGLPYSHDMQPLSLYAQESPGVELTQEDVDYPRLTQRFFERGARFIAEHQDRPFFLTLALTAPHTPLQPAPGMEGHSHAGAYGDVVMEIDRGVGALMAQLRDLRIDRDTLLIVTSDNGPWFEGSVGALRDRKGGAGWDGGYRVPLLVRQPGRVRAGRTSDALVMNIDLLPTIAAWTSATAPTAALDGMDISALLSGRARVAHDALILFDNENVAGIRTARWKYVVRTYYRTVDIPLDAYDYPLLFDLEADPGETYNVAMRFPEIAAEMAARVEAARTQFNPFRTRP